MNNTLTNGLVLMKTLAESGEPKTVKELSELLAWPKSHVCRLLKTLVDSGYIEQDSRRRYVVSVKILTLSSALLGKMDLRLRLRPFLWRLAQDSGHDAHLAVPCGDRPMIIDAAGAGATDASTIGAFNCIHATAAGKLFAAYRPEEGLDEFLDSLKFERFTDKTICSLDAFKAELEKIRRERVAVTNSEIAEGTTAIGGAVFNASGALAATLGIYTGAKLDGEALARLKKLVAEAAEAASYALGFPNWRTR